MANTLEERLKALQAAMAKIEKSYGHGSIMRLGEENIEKIDCIPTGSIGLNAALGIGGYPKGRIIDRAQFANRMILRNAMLRHGFKPYDCEWWHFTLADEPFPDTYFSFPVK